ncbi:nucleotide exchange factor GrpE [Candidatus Daviesbacteria bacterium]|nr:nucleotide exchange factor GrpE [Candidatus Daviesbacteria bacterium]
MGKKQKEDKDQLQIKLIDVENQLKRALADYQNLEKRVAEGRSELTNWYATELIKKLLTVLGHYEKALEGASNEDKASAWYKGVELATGQLQQVLKDEGLEEILITDGVFDPSLHEAVDMREPSDAEAMESKGDNMILEVVEKGYNLNGKVIKPVKVVVGKKQD